MTDYLSRIRLDGRTAVVTGGLGLIGREICRALAQAGARVIVVDIVAASGRRFAASLGGAAVYENFDLSRLELIDGFMESLRAKYGGPHILVNNAYPRTKDWAAPVEKLKLRSWRRNVDSQMNSYAWTARKACLMMKRQGGVVVNMGSIYGLRGNDFAVYKGTSLTSPMAYAAIKGGVTNLTRYLASYFGGRGIRVNTVCPGGVFNDQDRRFVRNYSARTPMGRMASPADVAGAVLFAASDLSSYMTGATLVVDGGWSAV